MPPEKRSVTWQAKVAKLVGWPKKGAPTKLGRLIGVKPRTVYTWFAEDRSPRNEDVLLARIALQLRVPRSWLTNGVDEPPPTVGSDAPGEWIQAVDASDLAPHVKRVAYALTDRRAAEYLADALASYERHVGEKRRP